jgi:hypothetical protein
MGTLRSKTNRAGVVVNGVILGDAPITLIDGSQPNPGDKIEDLWFVWDDARFPTGVVYASGAVDIDEES